MLQAATTELLAMNRVKPGLSNCNSTVFFGPPGPERGEGDQRKRQREAEEGGGRGEGGVEELQRHHGVHHHRGDELRAQRCDLGGGFLKIIYVGIPTYSGVKTGF